MPHKITKKIVKSEVLDKNSVPQEIAEAHQQAFIDANRRERAQKQQTANVDDSFPVDAQLCKKCQIQAVISMDNCLTCLNCGDSKCG